MTVCASTTIRAGFRGVALIVLSMLAVPVLPQEAPSERQVKAAYLYRFIDYVRWPEAAFPSKESPFVIGILAEPGMAVDLEAAIAARTIRGRPVVVRALREGERLVGAHVLFIGAALNPRLRQLIRSAEGPVLVVTEAEDGLSAGSVINFVLSESRVRFEVALGPAADRSLTISSGLLSVAINVRKGSRLDWRPSSLAFLR